MFKAGAVVDQVLAAMRSTSQHDLQAVWRAMNAALYDFASKHPFRAYISTITLDFSTGTDADGAHLLPSEVLQIDGVWHTTLDREYFGPITRAHGAGARLGGSGDPRYRWYEETPVAAPLLTVDYAAPTTDSASFTVTGDDWDEDYVGEWVTFEGTNGFYKLIDEWTLDRPYTGNNTGGAIKMMIRPTGTRRMVLLDYKDALDTSTVEVTYRRTPDHVHRYHHIIPLAQQEALYWACILQLLGIEDQRRLSRREWVQDARRAWNDLCAAEPPVFPERPAQGHDGLEVAWTAPWT